VGSIPESKDALDAFACNWRDVCRLRWQAA
jgi:hypothetical protein